MCHLIKNKCWFFCGYICFEVHSVQKNHFWNDTRLDLCTGFKQCWYVFIFRETKFDKKKFFLMQLFSKLALTFINYSSVASKNRKQNVCFQKWLAALIKDVSSIQHYRFSLYSNEMWRLMRQSHLQNSKYKFHGLAQKQTWALF